MPAITVDRESFTFNGGDTIAICLLRAGQHPRQGGCLCLAGDCGNCVAEVDGIAYVRTCQTTARDGAVVWRHPAVGAPSAYVDARYAPTALRRDEYDTVVIGGGASGRAEASRLAAGGRRVVVLDAKDGNEVVGIYGGPTVIVRTDDAMVHLHAHEVVVATGAAELHPVCPGSRLAGIVTTRAANELRERGVSLGRVVSVGVAPDFECEHAVGDLVRFEGSGSLQALVTIHDQVERRFECDTAVVGLGYAARDVLTRMAGDVAVRPIGSAAKSFALPPGPIVGVVCPCSSVTVQDLQGVWDRGFTDLELMKRASLCGTGTCQGGACVPQLRAFIAARSGEVPEPFTARPAARQLTLAEAALGYHVDPFRRTPLHDEHVALGATMDRWGGWWRPWNYGDHVEEYWAVRRAVSLGDVSTLGKMILTGPDAVELLERLYPTTVADIRPGRSRYVLLLNERGHVIDDGMICREDKTRFVLTFTSSGASNAEMWMRDWIDTWNLDVRLLDRTMSLAAINVTGPKAGELLRRAGVVDLPKFLQHRHLEVAGVPCHVMRLSFTGEASFELHHRNDRSVELWRSLMSLGADQGIKPHGLQALFGLRLEKGHVIVGADTELDTTPRRIGMNWAVKMEKAEFLGRTALARTAGRLDERRLVGLTMEGAAPNEGTPILHEGQIHGHVSSTFFSPLFGHTVMLGWLKRSVVPVQVTVDDRVATVTSTPFYDAEGGRARL